MYNLFMYMCISKNLSICSPWNPRCSIGWIRLFRLPKHEERWKINIKFENPRHSGTPHHIFLEQSFTKQITQESEIQCPLKGWCLQHSMQHQAA